MAVTRIVQSTLVRFLLAVGLVAVGGVMPASAQSYDDDAYGSSPPSVHATPDRGGASGLPAWAEPSSPSEYGTSSDRASTPNANAMAPPDLPDDPDRVPVDGGLALLAAAGAGYAIRKLRKDGAQEDDVADPVV